MQTKLSWVTLILISLLWASVYLHIERRIEIERTITNPYN